jgi:hypothetical protein
LQGVAVGGGKYAIGRVEEFTFHSGDGVNAISRFDFLHDSRWLGDCFHSAPSGIRGLARLGGREFD